MYYDICEHEIPAGEDTINLEDLDEYFFGEIKTTHKNCGDAVHSLMEQLYDKAHDIDIEQIKNDFLYLCEKLDVKNEYIKEAKDICVVHYTKSSRLEEKLHKEYTQKLKTFKTCCDELKRQLCGDIEEIDIIKTTNSLRELCSAAGTPMYWGQRVNIVREQWQLIGRSELLKLATNLIKQNSEVK